MIGRTSSPPQARRLVAVVVAVAVAFTTMVAFGARPEGHAVASATSTGELDPEHVRAALAQILPTGTPQYEPEGRVPVHRPVNFYTDAREFRSTITVLGKPVEVRAQVTAYQWNFGDGSVVVTAVPGQPRPYGTIEHTYDMAGRYMMDLDLTYRAVFRTAGGPWQPVPGPIGVDDGPTRTITVYWPCAGPPGDC